MSSQVSAVVAADKTGDRRAPRQRAFLLAKLSYLDGSISFDGSVVQISATGAKIVFTENVQLPDRFRIEIPQRRIDCQARIARRDEESLAVAFETAETAETAAEPSHAALMRRIQSLEAENRALRAKCKALAAQLVNASPSY